MKPRQLRRAGAALIIAVATAATATTASAASAAPTASAAAAEAATTESPACPEELSDVPASDFAKVNGVVPRPDVLVHGWDASAKSMQGYASLLKTSKVLHEPLEPFLFDYSANSGHWAAIPAITACLGAWVNKISTVYENAGGDGKVLAVGHSMGGLAIRFSSSAQYAAQPDGTVLGGVVTIDTPHLGSPWGDTQQAQLLQDYAQLKAGNWLEGMFPWPIGSDGQTCLATHVGTTGMPPGCPTPPWLPADVPVAEIGGDITVQRQVMGYTIDTADTEGDSVVATVSSLGYQPSSGPGAPPAPVIAPVTYTDGCQITTGQVEGGIGGYGISLLRGFESEILALFSRPPGTSLWNSPLTQPVATFLSLANKFAPCAHTNINDPATDPFASLDVLKALNADIDRLNGEPTQVGLLRASGMPHATAPVAVPGGYEAATWDNAGRTAFWRWTAATGWQQAWTSGYPALAASGTSAPGVTMTGALLTGMNDATFIATGPYSADGESNAIAYTDGPRGWGYLATGSSGTLDVMPGSARPVSAPVATALWYYFSDGRLVSQDDTGAFGAALGSWFPLERYWSWSGGRFAVTGDNIVTATAVSGLSTSGASLPSAAPPDGTYWAYITRAAPLRAAHGLENQVKLTLQPTCPPSDSGCSTPGAPSAGYSVTASAATLTIYPLVTGPDAATTQTVEYVTGPLWPVADFASSWGYSGGQGTWTDPADWGADPTYGQQPWLIPSSLAISGSQLLVAANQSAQLTFSGGRLTRLALYSPFPGALRTEQQVVHPERPDTFSCDQARLNQSIQHRPATRRARSQIKPS